MPDSLLELAKASQARLEREVADKPGVFGIGLGKDAGAFVLRVYVRDRRTAKILPKAIDGITVIPEVTGTIRAD